MLSKITQILRNKFNDFIEDKTDFKAGLKSIERFGTNNYIVVATDAIYNNNVILFSS